jgi:hypothetical protein
MKARARLRPSFHLNLRAASALVCAAIVMVASARTYAQTFEVPEGFVAHIQSDVDSDLGAKSTLQVVPADGTFASLSSIELVPLSESIEDPESWLNDRITMPTEIPSSADEDDALHSPDSPFDDPIFDQLGELADELREKLADLGKLPLKFCQPVKVAKNRAGEYHELSCNFEVGPFHKYTRLRLQSVDGLWYYTRITTMNERRLRHLVAIANSFHVD